ncbi:MAG: fused MFS/spermidine synthase [Lachnospiraceae bacterium]|nr:fused MFS/spermidine synthase [Lachnospiraceae bacterium]
MEPKKVEKRKILKNKIFLYLTEFFSGMSLMAVELGASRLLAPYFSSSQIVWTIIIGTIMIAMALGNLYGGRSADKNPNPDRLYGRIIIASSWIGLIPVVGKYIVIGIAAVMVFTVSNAFLVWAAFATCMIIFVFPLFLLGTVTPCLVKYTVDDLDDSGKIVGRLNASNTIGSIIGTFVPTFVTIPAVGTSITFLIFAGILLALAIIYFLSSKVKTAKVVVGAVVFILACIFGHSDSFAFWENDLAYEGESIYNYLQVKEDDSHVILSTNVLFGVQSVYEKSDTLTGMYYDYAMAAPLMAGINEKEELDILVLGMGTGTYATQCQRYFGDHTKLNITGVEIDKDITKLASEFFHLSEEIPVVTYDGRAYLNVIDKKYDVIMVDAYQDITIPFQMASVEFFNLVKDHLNPGGVMVVNMNMRGKEEGNMNQYLADTISEVFSEVCTVDVPYATNRELFATNVSDYRQTLTKNIDKEKNADLKNLMKKLDKNLVDYVSTGYVMTDDKAPVELLSMRMIDDLIGEETEYYKEIYKNEGLQGLINALQ